MLNPGVAAVADSDLDLVVAGTKDAVLMVESEANGLSEEVMLGAVMFGHEQMQAAIDAINELAAEVGKPAWDWQAPEADEDLAAAVAAAADGWPDRCLPDYRQAGTPGSRWCSQGRGR